MIKLKIGDNYLLTDAKERDVRKYITYMMGCFEKHGQTAMGLDFSIEVNINEYIKAIKENRITKIYILFTPMHGEQYNMLQGSLMSQYRKYLQNSCPELIMYFIDITKKEKSKDYKLASKLYEALELDPENLLSHLKELGDYKEFNGRFRAIPEELKVINENIKKLNKEKQTSQSVCTLDKLDYLHLIKEAHLEGNDLVMEFYPLNINPSEPFGRCMSKDTFQKNKYMAKVAEYLYNGFKFWMPGTRIVLHTNFTPEFIETTDHRFDDMFAKHNWSNIGYPHFGRGHFCGGEMNDVIAHTAEHGLEYFFICLKQYLTTANMRDYAGRKVWWYPIVDTEGKIVYCAGLEMLRDVLLSGSIGQSEKDKIKNMSYEDFLQWKKNHGIGFNIDTHSLGGDYFNSYNGPNDTFIEYCKENNIVLKEGA